MDALQILASLRRIPPYHVWIIGGLDAERAFVERLVCSSPPLSAGLRSGAVRVWGRIETTALAEFYSRSTVLVVPSSREQFGLVAVEAMMCGCPVVGSSVGGLQDLIAPGMNGRRVPVDDASLLANVLSGYLRDPDMARRQGTTAAAWARRTLAQHDVYPLYADVYAGKPATADPLRAGWARIRQCRVDTIVQVAERLLGTAVERVDDVCSGRHVATRLVFADGRACFAKQVAEPDWPEGAGRPLRNALAPRWTPAEFVSAYEALPAEAPVPVLARADAAAGVVINPWHEPADGGLEAVRQICQAFRACPLPTDDSVWGPALQSVARDRSQASLDRFDLAAAALGACGSTRRFRSAHPQVELLRLSRMIRMRCWSLPDSFSARARGVIAVLLREQPVAVQQPALCHGDLHARRLLRGPAGPLACDPETWRYAWGPLDESRYVFHLVRERETMSAATALRQLDALVDADADRHLGACWLVVHMLDHAIQELTRGSTAGVNRAMRFFHGLYEALYGRGVTR